MDEPNNAISWNVITDFLERGFSEKGVAVATLQSLSPIYPKTSLMQLASLQRKTSKRTERAGDTDKKPAFAVVFFKSVNDNLPAGVTVVAFAEFFTAQFKHDNSAARAAFKQKQMDLIENPFYYVLAVTVPVFSLEDSSQLFHYIVGAAMFMYDKRGIFISSLGVTASGSSNLCSLTSKFFIDAACTGILDEQSPSFRCKGLATFLLSFLQVLGHLGFKAPVVDPSSEAFLLCCELSRLLPRFYIS